jgi:hypothetical protein
MPSLAWACDLNLIPPNIATSESVVYNWDHRNRLTIITYKNSLGVITKQVHYVYDSFDRLIARKVDANGNGLFDTREK